MSKRTLIVMGRRKRGGRKEGRKKRGGYGFTRKGKGRGGEEAEERRSRLEGKRREWRVGYVDGETEGNRMRVGGKGREDKLSCRSGERNRRKSR